MCQRCEPCCPLRLDRRNPAKNKAKRGLTQFRRLWMVRINAAAREHGLSYSRFIAGLKEAGIEVDRKVLADIAMHEKDTFAALAKRVQPAAAKAA